MTQYSRAIAKALREGKVQIICPLCLKPVSVPEWFLTFDAVKGKNGQVLVYRQDEIIGGIVVSNCSTWNINVPYICVDERKVEYDLLHMAGSILPLLPINEIELLCSWEHKGPGRMCRFASRVFVRGNGNMRHRIDCMWCDAPVSYWNCQSCGIVKRNGEIPPIDVD